MRKALVLTGATKGLGLSLFETCISTGYSVLGFYGRDHAAAEDLRRLTEAKGISPQLMAWDFRTPDDPPPEIPAALQRLNGMELAFIHCACAPFLPKAFHMTDWKEGLDQFMVAAGGAWRIAQLVLPAMVRARRGTIAFVLSSAMSDRSIPNPKGLSGYLVAKHALAGLASCIAAEYSSSGVRVLTFSPQFMDTPLTRNWPESTRALASRNGSVDPDTYAKYILRRIEDPTLQAPTSGLPLML